ncbi:MAG: hypothetical protein IPN49_07890 [Saprospiraceae bacterium]|nr:hypothetical protein [Saprospiraceae bacterium]
MIKFSLVFSFLILFITYNVNGQSLKSLNGYEWIVPGKKYCKVKIAETGLYRINIGELTAAGLDVSNTKASGLQVWNFGKQIPIYVSTNERLESEDYVEFVGEKLTIGLDSLLFSNWNDEMLNTEYSFVTDSNTYFIAIDTSSVNLRYQTIQPDYASGSNPILPFYLHEDKKIYNDIFYKIQHGLLQYSNFEPAEGWAKQGEKNSSHSFNLSDYYPDGGAVTLGSRISSTIFFTRIISKINGSAVDTQSFGPATIRHLEYSIQPENVQNEINLEIQNNLTEDLHRTAFSYIKYPRLLNFANKNAYNFNLRSNPGTYLLPIQNFNHGGNPCFIYNPVSGTRTEAKLKDINSMEVILEVFPSGRYFVINQTNGFKQINKIQLFESEIFEKSETNYLIISHKSLKDGSLAYAEYRKSPNGGAYKVSVLEMDKIYNHFGYGIDNHFYALNNLSKFLKNNWDSLAHVFLLGKGLSYTLMRTASDIQKHEGVNFFVPGYGIPSSDIMLFSDFNKASPHFAVGRYAALNNNEIFNYLDKVKGYENAQNNNQSIEDKFWMKRVMHLSGGGNPSEQSLIKNNLLNMQSRLENSKMGSKVSTFFKTSTDQLASASLESITNLFNSGVNIVTFYGHSAPGTWDFNLEDPSKYTNYNKYPLINSLGCYSGNIFGEKSETISERFVKIKDKGAIGFIASGGTASVTQLGTFGYEQYSHLGNENYGKSIGYILKVMAKKYEDAKYDTYALYQQMILHCDPAIKLYNFEGPDYIFDYSSIKTIPELINSSTDSITLFFDVYNLGKGKEDSIDLAFYHVLPDNTVFDTVKIKILSPGSYHTFSLKFKNAGVKGIGKNTILGKIDPDNKVYEMPENMAKNNNDLVSGSGNGFVFYILDNTAIPVEPCNFAIVNNPEITLKASTSNALIKRGNYIFQIDTTLLFNSPVFAKQVVQNVQGLIEWKPTIPFTPGTVYYWRVSADSISPDAGYTWKPSSFVFLPDNDLGFNQSHYFQYSDNNKFGHIFIDNNRKFRFPFGEYLIDIVNGVYSNFSFGTIGFKFNFENPAASIRPWNFMPNGGVCLVVVNPVTSSGIINNGGDFGSISGGSSSRRCYGFLTSTSSERKKVIDFLQNNVPKDHYVYFFTVMNTISNDLKVEEWQNDLVEFGTSIPELLKEQGALLIDSLLTKGSLPYTFKYTNNKGAINEGLLEDLTQIISTKSFLPYIRIEATIKIENIGPASRWDRLEYKLRNVEDVDTTYINVYGVREGNFIDTLVLKEKSTSFSLEHIDPKLYPNLQVELYFKDAVNRSAPDVENFRIFFDPVADMALDPKKNYRFLATKLNRGETLVASVALTNLSNENVDSVFVKYSIINLEDNSEINEFKKVGPLPPNQNIILDFQQKMLGKPGKHVFVVEANHDKIIAEKHYFNNIGKQEFEVLKDKSNPFLDVYFDGQKILDGDIVSTKPNIKLMLKDENAFLSLDNPELFSIKLDTGRNQIKEIPLTSAELSFEKPAGPNEPAILNYNPSFKTGDYKLIVQAKDASGNFAGVNERVVSFRVIEEESVTHILNYPNPFSTSTQFVFTLTGEQAPEDFSIRIFTVTGKLIREISKEELGLLRIGTNRTQFKWDGTDQFGQKLANGVYLYKAFINNSQGQSYKTNKHNRVDQAFNEGFGKMVILR